MKFLDFSMFHFLDNWEKISILKFGVNWSASTSNNVSSFDTMKEWNVEKIILNEKERSDVKWYDLHVTDWGKLSCSLLLWSSSVNEQFHQDERLNSLLEKYHHYGTIKWFGLIMKHVYVWMFDVVLFFEFFFFSFWIFLCQFPR